MRNLVKKNDDSLYIRPILKGKVIQNPRYKKQELEEYSNNPFIEALPNIFDENDIIDMFTYYPIIEDSDRRKRKNIRYHMIKRVKDFIQPLEIHFTIEKNISTMIRRGYLARNPIDKEYFERLRAINEIDITSVKEKESKFLEMEKSIRSTADSLSVIGISGIGKTTAIERLISMYPQVIHHNDYKGQQLIRTQIVWLKIDCPFDGSIKTLCKHFFKAIDEILGTTRYFYKYGNNRNSAATMMIHMTYLAALYGIGILIIDEIQHLINPKNNPDEMLNFFVTLVNTIGIPTVLIGTFKALKIFKKDFRQARRAGSEGNIVWDRMDRSDEWDFFINTLFEFQWLKEKTEFSEEINNVMYEESQGITAIAVNLFILAQCRALNTDDERITKNLIKKTAKEDLNMIRPMIEALRTNNIRDISKYEDISINLDEILKTSNHKLDLAGKIKEIANQNRKTLESIKHNTIENLILDIHTIGVFDKLTEREIEELANKIVKKLGVKTEYNRLKQVAIKRAMELNDKKQKKKNEAKKLSSEDLRGLYKKSKKKKIHMYDLLKEKKYIKNPLDEFLKVN